jgi:lipopolysaccharide/colanic/teichoic acid biosynthesis glycosyltransferase
MSGKVDGSVLATENHLRKHKRSGIPYDPRVTPLGYFLRRSSVDELPQLFNILRGEMSLVGPRPPIMYEVNLYKEWHLGRLETLPGITGLWQVHGRSRVTFDTMVKMDLEYIAKQSFWYDVKLILLTIPAVFSREGAY